MISWFKEFGNVPADKFHAAIWIHENKNETKAKAFWSNITGIPQKNFYKSYITENKTKSKKIRKTFMNLAYVPYMYQTPHFNENLWVG